MEIRVTPGYPSANHSVSNVKITVPDLCPWCGHLIAPSHILSNLSFSDYLHSKVLTSFFCCNACSRVFAREYHLMRSDKDGYFGCPLGLIPPERFVPNIDADIVGVSPRFSDLVYQAGTAAKHGLVDLAGMGYRKALECLLKDSLVYLGAPLSDVEKLSLSEAIKKFSSCCALTLVADTIRVVGNDFTHYSAKYEPFDIDDLNTLISAVSHAISLYVLSERLKPTPK